MKSIIKQDILFVPPHASNEYLFGSSADCLIGLPLLAEDSDIAMIDGTYKVLKSNDKTVLECTWQDLCYAVNYRLRTVHFAFGSAPPVLSSDHLAAYLSGDRFLGTNQNMTLFTQARQASFRLGVRWNFNRDKNPL